MPPRPGVQALVLAAGVLAVSWAAIFVRLSDEAPALTIAAYRLLFASAVLVPVAFIAVRLGRDRLPPRAIWPALALSGLFLAGHFWSWFASLERTSVGSSVVIVGMQPLLGGLLAFAVLRERPSRAEYVGLAIALAGLLVIGADDLARDVDALIGDALALLGALLVAAYQTVRRTTRIEASTLAYSATVYAVAAAVLWVLVAATGTDAGGFGGDTWTYLILLALVPQLIGHTALNWCLGRLRVVTVGLAILGEPVVATALAVPILDDEPTAGVLIGGPIILVGVGVGLWPRRDARATGEGASPPG